jgi:ankyrin repeat protein
MAAAGQLAMTQKQLNRVLWHACGARNDLPHAVELLNRGADPNVLLMWGKNALHMAAMSGRLEMVTMLLDRGAVLESRSDWGSNALTLAALYDRLEVCLLLIARGADLRVVNNHNQSALSHYGD